MLSYVPRLLLVGCLLATPLFAAPGSSGGKQPNIIFILADDLGYGDLGAYGQKKIKTPHLDLFASQGTRFTDFYPGAAVCAPTRAVMMTGLHTGHARVRGNHGEAELDRVTLEMNDLTVAELLRRGGYSTAGFGKWGLGIDKGPGHPFKNGFDLWVGYLDQDLAEDYYPEELWRNERDLIIPENQDGKKGRFSNDLFTDEALAFIESRKHVPFFVYLAYTIPHAVWDVPEDSLRQYQGVFPEDPSLNDTTVKTAAPRATYAAMVSRLDGYVGQIVEKVKELGLDENTIILFASDNGATDKAGVARFFGSAGPLKGYKGSLNEGGIRAPMLVRWPGRVPAGRVSQEPWAGWDIFPTFAELAGIPLYTDVPTDGVSMVSELIGRSAPARDYLYWEIPSRKKAFAQAVRIGDFKVVRHDRDQPIEVYNVRVDIGETRNLAAERPDLVARARELFRNARTPSPHWPVEAPKA